MFAIRHVETGSYLGGSLGLDQLTGKQSLIFRKNAFICYDDKELAAAEMKIISPNMLFKFDLTPDEYEKRPKSRELQIVEFKEVV